MNPDQYGHIMERLGTLAAEVKSLRERQDNLRDAYDKHIHNEHAHPPYPLTGRRSKKEAAVVVVKLGGGGIVAYAILEALSRLFLGL